MVPYNAIPIEAHVAMISAEQANVAVLVDAARMWTEVRAWIEDAKVELHTHTQNLVPTWQDQAGRDVEVKFQRTLAELTMWGERIDASQVSETLTTLSGAIPPAFQAVTGLYQSYLAALSNPFTAWAALGFQQAAGVQMTALGAQFALSMLKVCAAAGLKTPDVVLPSAKGNSPTEVMSAAESVLGAMTKLEGLASAAGVTSPLTDPSALPSSDGPSLAGLPGGPSLAGLSGLSGLGTDTIPGFSAGSHPGSGLAPTLSSSAGGLGTAGPSSLPMTTPVSGKRSAGTTAEIRPGTAASAAGTSGGGMAPPMMPAGGAKGGGGTLRPGSTAQGSRRTRRDQRAPDATAGVPAELRGRAGSGEPEFGVPPVRSRHDGEPLDAELWDLHPAAAE